MIRSSNLLRCYSLENGPKKYRLVGDERKPLETLSENSREFEKLMLCLYLIERYVANEKELSFETRWPAMWQEKKELLEQLFEFLTHRKLGIRFHEQSCSTEASQERIMVADREVRRKQVVSLFSGGLDSAAGAIDLVRGGITPTLSHTATGKIILGKATELLKTSVLRTIPAVVTDVKIHEGSFSDFGSFNCRGLLFISNALVIASSLGHGEICLPENGPLMINPSVSLRSEPTRNAHPFLVTALEEIYNHVTDSSIRITAIFKDATKAEVAAKIVHEQVISKTWSCFNVQGQSKMCGACFACMVRRLSLLATGYQEPRSTYRVDPFAENMPDNNSSLGWKFDTIHDTFIYLGDLLRDRLLQRSELFMVPKGFFADEMELMTRFSLDMFLGFKKHVQLIGSSNLGPLGRFAERIGNNVPQSELDQRERELDDMNTQKAI